MTGVQALLFDLGGVLIELHWNRAFEAWSLASGVPAADIAPRFRRDAVYEAHECGTLDDAAFFESLRGSLGIRLSDAQFLAGWNAIFGDPFPDAAAQLRAISSRTPVYVFSNTNPAHVAHWKPRYQDLLAPVRKVFCSCEIGHRKPRAEAFHRVAAQIGVAPAAIAFFDDLEENAAGARAAGLMAFHVPRPADLHATLERLMT